MRLLSNDEKLINAVAEDFKLDVLSVVNSVKQSTKTFMMSPQTAFNCLSDLGLPDSFDEYDTNGWEQDFWFPVTYDGCVYELSGSMYMGNLRFSKKS